MRGAVADMLFDRWRAEQGTPDIAMKKWLTAPSYDDPEIRLRAHILHWISLIGFLVLTPLTALLPVLETDYRHAAQIYGASLIGVAACFVLLHRGSVNAAAVTMAVLGWFITMWVSFATGGLASPQLSMGVLAIMLAGILLSGWGA